MIPRRTCAARRPRGSARCRASRTAWRSWPRARPRRRPRCSRRPPGTTARGRRCCARAAPCCSTSTGDEVAYDATGDEPDDARVRRAPRGGPRARVARPWDALRQRVRRRPARAARARARRRRRRRLSRAQGCLLRAGRGRQPGQPGRVRDGRGDRRAPIPAACARSSTAAAGRRSPASRPTTPRWRWRSRARSWRRARTSRAPPTPRTASGTAASRSTSATPRAAALNGYLMGESQANGSLMRASPARRAGARRDRRAGGGVGAGGQRAHPPAPRLRRRGGRVRGRGGGRGRARRRRATPGARRSPGPAGRRRRRRWWTRWWRPSTAARAATARTRAGSSIALQNAFHDLLHAPSVEEGVVASVARGGRHRHERGDRGRAARRRPRPRGRAAGRGARMVLSCRAHPLRARHARPRAYWATDLYELSERVLLAGDAAR